VERTQGFASFLPAADSPEQFWELAKRCRDRAESSIDPARRRAFEKCAAILAKLAAQIEARRLR
jgi:acyl transferase domain-containing protein